MATSRGRASLPVVDILDNDHIFTCVAGPFAATPGTITNTATASGNGGSPVSDTDRATYANIALAFKIIGAALDVLE